MAALYPKKITNTTFDAVSVGVRNDGPSTNE
jgi:hypothetical protein